MGGTISIGPSSMSERKRKVRKSKKEEERQRKEDEARRKQLLETYGVLIPPVFLANKTDNPPLSSKVWEKIANEASSAQLSLPNETSDLLSWAYRRRQKDEFDAGPLLGQSLLNEYMTPGLFLSLPIAASERNDGGRFVAALTQQSKDSGATDSSPPSFLALTKCFHNDSSLFFPFPWKIEAFLPQTAVLSSPSSINYSIPSSMRVVADLSSPSNKNTTQVAWTTHFLEPTRTPNTPSTSPLWTKVRGSWIEAETTRPDCFESGIRLRLASAMTVDSVLNQVVLEGLRAGNDAYLNYTNLPRSSDRLGDFLRKHQTPNTNETVRLRMAAEYKESILASSTNLSLSSLLGHTTNPIVTNTDTLLSLNLNGGDETLSSQPPLWLTLQQTKGYATAHSPSSFAINLSQVVTFDREIWNILEDRAPKVRNHLGWVCQIQRSQNTDSNEPSTSVLSMGASAQFNRNLAAKVLFESKLGATTPTESKSPSAALKFAVVLKRWLEPQASLSVIQKVDLVTGKWSFLGLGLELEQNKSLGSSNTKKSQRSNSKRSDAEYRTTADIDASNSVAPPTKVRVELPHDKR